MNLEDLEKTVAEAIKPGFRKKLLAQGQARSMIWNEGILPDDAPKFSPMLTYNLLSYGSALLSLAIRMREQNGDQDLAREAFKQAGEAIEAVVSKGDPKDPQRGFLRTLSASSFHLARLSASAFSILSKALENSNLSRIEKALALLILRYLNELEQDIVQWHRDGQASDDELKEQIKKWADAEEDSEEKDDILYNVINDAVSDKFFRGLGYFMSALRTGEADLMENAKEELKNGLAQCSQLNLVPQWWCFRLAGHLIDDLWQVSFHEVLPRNLPSGNDTEWSNIRELYIASLFCRERAEIELWPSQIDAARRSIDPSDDLVVSLPTSAGKTRIAELCILRCLSEGKRVVFVTPLRALSAQTEVSLQKIFGPLGKKISTLYGSIGISNFEDNALKERDIVVSTPEKLDFALRNDPTIIDDVGLIILDEGHMIGIGEREVRYEVQIQRLLKRPDADQRRIVCLSAVLPEGDEFDDFVKWLRRDKNGEAVRSDWMPTRRRFGEVLWFGDHARLDVRVDDEDAFVPRFFEQKKSKLGRRRNLFPHDQREFVLATAWRLVKDEQSVLIYCPMRKSVERYAKDIVKLISYGLLEPLIKPELETLSSALAIGEEWLGCEHPILNCLKAGIAVHHGGLPTPFRKEMERLLRKRIPKIIISSSTLAQGLNLTATTILMHSLHRHKEIIPTPEFKNVIGRAGRAFVDIEGLILFPIFDKVSYRKNQWDELITSSSSREMASGLVQLVVKLLGRINRALGIVDYDSLREYVLNNAVAWDFTKLDEKSEKDLKKSEQEWARDIALLDTAVLSLLGESELAIEEIASQLDSILSSSLWCRLLVHQKQKTQDLCRAGLVSRAQMIWSKTTSSQRRGYFLAGVGFSTGQELDNVSKKANELLVEANAAIQLQQQDTFINAITALSEIVFDIYPFNPNPYPKNWRETLRRWLQGEAIAQGDVEVNEDTLRFIENGLIYKLPWALEAVRVRAQANGDKVGEMGIEDFEIGSAVPAIETGTMNISAAILMQAGFTSRLAAIKAANDTEAKFTNSSELKTWLNSEVVNKFSEDSNWPTPESHTLWKEFRENFAPHKKRTWSVRSGVLPVSWSDGVEAPAKDTILILQIFKDGSSLVMSACFDILGEIDGQFSVVPSGLMRLSMGNNANEVRYEYYGPDDLSFHEG